MTISKGTSMGSYSTQRSKINPIQKLCILYLIVWTISPPLSIDLKYRLIALACAIVWFLFAIDSGKFLRSTEEKAAVVFLLFLILVALLNGGLDGVLKSIALYLLVIGFLMFKTHIDDFEELEWIIILVLILLSYFNIKTYQALLANDHIARMIVRNDVETYYYLRQGVGGYGYIICQVIMSPVLLLWTLSAFQNKNVLKIVSGTACYLSFLLMLLKASYAIPIFATFIGAILCLFGTGEHLSRNVIISVLTLLGLLYLIGFNESFRNFLLNAFPSNAIQNKVNELIASINGGELQGDFAARWVRYLVPIKTFFLEYPVIGGWLMNEGAGGHSALLDMFGKYGLFGGIMNFKMIFSVANHYRSRYQVNLRLKRTTAALWTVLFIAMGLDSWQISCPFILFIMVSIMLDDIGGSEMRRNSIVNNASRI